MACWSVDIISKRSEHLGVVSAPNETEALAKAIKQVEIDPTRQKQDHGHPATAMTIEAALLLRMPKAKRSRPAWRVDGLVKNQKNNLFGSGGRI